LAIRKRLLARGGRDAGEGMSEVVQAKIVELGAFSDI
jgi:hypothetical protein